MLRTHKGLVGRWRDLEASSSGRRPEADGRLEAVEAAGADGRRGVTGRPVEQVRRRRGRRRERAGCRQEALGRKHRLIVEI